MIYGIKLKCMGTKGVRSDCTFTRCPDKHEGYRLLITMSKQVFVQLINNFSKEGLFNKS